MTDTSATAVAFGLAGGTPHDTDGLLHVDSEPGPDGRRLLLAVEPLEPGRRAREVAAVALAAVRTAVAEAGAQSPAAALRRAFAVANAAVRDENRRPGTAAGARKVYVGVTAVVLDGRDLTIAQVPPSQLLVVQERQLYAFPSLASWRPDYVPESERPGPEPLGYADDVRPDFFRSVAAGGDLLALCSSMIGYYLAWEALGTAATPAVTSVALLDGDPERACARLEEIVVGYGLDDAHAACIALAHVPRATLQNPTLLLSRLSGCGGASGVGDGAVSDVPRRRSPAVVDCASTPDRARSTLRGGTGKHALAAVGIPLDRDLDDAPDVAGFAASGPSHRPRSTMSRTGTPRRGRDDPTARTATNGAPLPPRSSPGVRGRADRVRSTPPICRRCWRKDWWSGPPRGGPRCVIAST